MRKKRKKSLAGWIPDYEFKVMRKAQILPVYFNKPKIGKSKKVRITIEEL